MYLGLSLLALSNLSLDTIFSACSLPMVWASENLTKASGLYPSILLPSNTTCMPDSLASLSDETSRSTACACSSDAVLSLSVLDESSLDESSSEDSPSEVAPSSVTSLVLRFWLT